MKEKCREIICRKMNLRFLFPPVTEMSGRSTLFPIIAQDRILHLIQHPPPPTQKRVREIKGVDWRTAGDFRKGTRLGENRQGAGSTKIEMPAAASRPLLSHPRWQHGFVRTRSSQESAGDGHGCCEPGLMARTHKQLRGKRR